MDMKPVLPTFMGKKLEDDRVDMVGQGDQMWRWDAADAVYGNSSLAYSTNSTLATRNVSNMTGVTLSHPYYQHSMTVAASFIMAYLFIFLLCMVGNGLVCLIVLRNRCMRTVTNLFIFNLAISDLLVGVFCIPTTLVDNLITGWPFSNAVCKLSGLVQGTSVSASVFTLVAIAVDRYRCIVCPFKPKLTPQVARVTIALIWILALLIMCPSAAMLLVEQEEGHYMVDSEDINKTYPLYYCYESWPEPEMRKVYTTVLFAHIYLIPLVLITLMYCRIGAKLYTTAGLTAARIPERLPPNGSQGRAAISPKKIKAIKMLIMVALLFMLSWLPLWTLMLLIDYVRPEGAQLDLLTGYIFPFAHWLAFSNSSVNPIIYGYFNENFKRGFRAAWQAGLCGRWREWLGVGGERRVCTHQETAVNTHTFILGSRNRVHTDGSQTDCVRLEMEQRKFEAVGMLCPKSA
ncbi:neuropeptide FF receptor 1-like isoform X1 [Paramormyrops kingsleyae]|uniref:neuropeptide FF receptor 1-like isoform X1 n=2 Tax=Paramormyrops kingsleyae TaxID=1676925 RepID=UPI003B971E93